MSKMRILISGHDDLEEYVNAINEAGGEATAKYLPEIDTGYDGLVLCGGNDINPEYYNEAIDGAVNIDSARDKVEIALLEEYVKLGKPILGICRGCQLINVFFGGSLYQDLPETASHRSDVGKYDMTHSVKADCGSVLGKLYGESFVVNTSHHQAVKKLGRDLRASVYWNNQHVEAIEHKHLPIIGVQWHPEKMCESKIWNVANGTVVFGHFVEMCRGNKNK